jgi:PAS domain S-box-containing protein
MEPLRDRGGEVVGLTCVAADITERKRREEELRRSEGFLSSIVEHIPLMVFVKDAEDLRFELFNRAGEELLGYSRHELIGKNDFDFFPKEKAEHFTGMDREVLAKGEMMNIAEEPIDTKYGPRVLHTRKIPVLDEDGNPRYLVGISEDITERKQAQEQVRQAKEEAERANKAKSEFLSRMSHELRTPLNAILGFGQLLESADLQPNQRERVVQMMKGGRHLLELINEVLDISRIEAGSMPISLEPVHVESALTDVLDLIAPLAAERGISLERPSKEAADKYVLADNQRLRQVMLNLLSNAIKYNREGGKAKVSFAETSPGSLLILVTDTGKGIPEDQQRKLFTPFERLGAEQSAIEGTGLGLALSKLLIEAMGGTLGVESEPWIGATFIVKLALVDAPSARSLTSAAGAGSVAMSEHDGPTRTILYVEDNPSNLKLVEEVLATRPGIRLVSVMNGNLALELAQQHRPDLVLLDLHLPGVPGEAVLRRLRADPETKRVPVVVVSADATDQSVEKLLASGANAYVAKPFEIDEFLAVIDEVFSERQPA